MVADHQGCQYQRRVIVRGKIIRTRNLKPGEPRDLLMAVKHMVDEIAAAADAIAANSSQLHYSCKAPLHKEELLANSRCWHGGWCWRYVSELLEKKGHKVFSPTLTGLGERSHLLSNDITLDIHIADIVNV